MGFRKGVTYQLNGEKIKENHFDFKNTIIKELQTQIDSINRPGLQVSKDWEAINKQWREGVGGAQKKLPMHVVYEYCSTKVSFNPVLMFTNQPQPSKEFDNWVTDKKESWFARDSKLGVSFVEGRIITGGGC